MSGTLGGLYPPLLWKNFEEICAIPHPSKKEVALREHLIKKFGKEGLGFETFVDQAGNLLIRKPATPGFENRKGVILQGHLDMVPEKLEGFGHNFDTDPIVPVIEDDWVTTGGKTTLGADNGIGVAAALAILEDPNVKHGPLDVLLTVDEETGLTGAFGLQKLFFRGEILLNLDSEEGPNEFFVGCSGGTNVVVTLPYERMKVHPHSIAMELTITGLSGGHSGLDVKDFKPNANKLLARFLYEVRDDIQIASLKGGTLRNAIAKTASVVFAFSRKDAEIIKNAIEKITADFKAEYATIDPGIHIRQEYVDVPPFVMDIYVQNGLIWSMFLCPDSTQRMSNDLPGLVETSSNFAIIETGKKSVKLTFMIRSSVNSARENLKKVFDEIFDATGATVVEFTGEYPGWQINPSSKIRKLMEQLYTESFDEEVKIVATHGGLECGVIGEVQPLDMISFGPVIKGAHTPQERVSISSTEKFWNFLVIVLENIPAKETDYPPYHC